jgi:PAS domain S-box-containing protein
MRASILPHTDAEGPSNAKKRRQAADQPAVEKETSLDAIIEHFDGFVWSIDRDLQYIVLNTALRKKIKELTGLDAREGDKMTDLLGMLDPSRALIWEDICQCGFAGERQRMVKELSIGGQAVFYEVSINPIYTGGNVVGLSCFARDLTEEKLTERKLRGSEMRFRSLIEKGTDIIVVVDGEGRISYSSPSIEHYFGVDDAENLGKNAFDYIHPEDVPRLAETFMEVLNSPGKPITVQSRAQTKEGKPIWVEGTVTNLLGIEGINGIVCNFRDVTERKEMEKRILQASIDAQEREREEIGRELHDNVNQILTTARLYLDIHETTSDQGAMLRRISEIVTTAIEEIRKLSRSMTQSFHKEIGLKLSIEDLLSNIKQLPESIRVNFEFFLPSEPSLDDKLKITIFRIVQEQLNNVLKHAAASAIHVSLKEEGALLLLRINDNGQGFDPRKKREGIGINNIINRAELFNGQVNIESSAGMGCRLFVSFRLK